MIIIPATKEHIDSFYSKQMAKTCIAYAAMDGDKVIGIAGFYTEGGRRVLFSEMTDEARKYPIMLFKAGLKLVKMATDSPLPLQAVADCNIEASERFLKRLGFAKIGLEVWQWQTQ